MKREKIYLTVIMLLVTVAILLVISTIFIINNKNNDKDKPITDAISTKTTFVCSKVLDDNSEYKLTSKYTFELEEYGTISKYDVKSIYKYKNKDAYENAKTDVSNESKPNADDTNLELTTIDNYPDIKDSWYYWYKSNLTNEGYECKEK